jgi:hypothetical protein
VVVLRAICVCISRFDRGRFWCHDEWLTAETGGLGYIRFLAPPEKILRWIEGKLNLLGRLPHYVSVDQKTYGRYGVLPSSSTAGPSEHMDPVGLGWVGGTGAGGQRLGP